MLEAFQRGAVAAVLFSTVAALPAVAGPHTVDYVNPLIGTDPITDSEYVGGNPVPGEELYSGTVNPGAMVPDPNGYVCVGPVTGFDGGFHVRGSGYRFSDATIMGFAQLNGEYSDHNKLVLMPTVGAVKTTPGSRADPATGYRAAKDPGTEKAAAGYYTVSLRDSGIKVELTATANCGFNRYTFPHASAQANVLLDLANSQLGAAHASLKIPDQHTVEGFQTSGKETVYFRAVFSKDFASAGTWKGDALSPGAPSESGTPIGAYATFQVSESESIAVKVGTSTVSLEEAVAHLKEEAPDFETARRNAEALWAGITDRVRVEGGSEGDRTNFYTAVYRAAAGPNYSWFPGGANGALILTRGADWVARKLASVKPKWAGGYWGPGNVSGIVGLLAMGFHDFDVNGTYRTLRESAFSGGEAAGAAYRNYGYIPAESDVPDYVNRSIGMAYDDYALAQFAKAVGNNEDYSFFADRARGYARLFNSSVGFFAPRKKDGSWMLPLDPIEPHAEDVYREGNAWNYLWFNAGDIGGLVKLLGGVDRFRAKLDTFFTAAYRPKVPLRDLTGVIGLYFHGNEQYRHIPYLYNYAAEPWKTQALARKIQKALYRPVPAGLCGMDDYGALEGWYVTSALGYGNVDRASGVYEIGSPLFPRVTIKLDGPRPGEFVIEAKNVSDANMYIQSATLNGKPLDAPQFRQSDIVAGGSLVFEMGPEPNKQWGLGPRTH